MSPAIVEDDATRRERTICVVPRSGFGKNFSLVASRERRTKNSKNFGASERAISERE